MSETSYKTVVTRENFEQDVLVKSQEVPILIDFWADWCAPCKILMPILEKLAEEYQGAFHLAKVNTDEQQELAAAFQIRSLPTVKLFINGQIVDEFMGAQPETVIRELLDQHVKRPSDSELDTAGQLIAEGRIDDAIAELEAAREEDPHNLNIASRLALMYVEQKQYEKAETVYKSLDEKHLDSPEGQAIGATIKFSKESAELIDVPTAVETLKQNPEDPEALYSYSVDLILKKHYRDALDNFLKLMQKHRQFRDGAAQKALIESFKIIGDSDSLVSEYRKKMTRLLF